MPSPTPLQYGQTHHIYNRGNNREKAYQRTGSLFQHPFVRIPVTSDAYFTQLVAYIHHNPGKHGLVDDLRLWPHSSYHTLLTNRPTRLMRNDVLAWFGSAQAFQAFHQQDLNERQIAPLIRDDFD